jgi:ubiquinone/menaquinone biosynthesis C-methylase UbiE
MRQNPASRLPWPAATFDLVVSTTSFDHWADQRAGLAECARVLAPGGCLVLADLFSVLLPTLLAGRRGSGTACTPSSTATAGPRRCAYSYGLEGHDCGTVSS